MSQNPFYFQPPWNSDEDNAPRDYSRSIPLPPSVSPAPQRPLEYPPNWNRSMSYPRTTAVSYSPSYPRTTAGGTSSVSYPRTTAARFSPSYPRTAAVSVDPIRPDYDEEVRAAGIGRNWAREDRLARARQLRDEARAARDEAIAELTEARNALANAPDFEEWVRRMGHYAPAVLQVLDDEQARDEAHARNVMDPD